MNETDKEKVIARKTQLGGFGTGSYLKLADPAPGVDFGASFEQFGDKALVQFDESSLKPESTNVETCTLYKLIVMIEKSRRVAKVPISFLQCTRGESTDDSIDSFQVAVTQKMKYVPVPPSEKDKDKVKNNKNFFQLSTAEVAASSFLAATFRFRFEKVGSNLKVQKPYVCTQCAMKIQPGKPIKAGVYCHGGYIIVK